MEGYLPPEFGPIRIANVQTFKCGYLFVMLACLLLAASGSALPTDVN